ncbi:hypothetical protein GIB67_038004 [Kingdonia uniflora]|uniref:DUF1771 domain-containing protein n=1 Tax=Kingdonia uniflora TaxID=39325 RepID=A0A7J7LHB3_9MAGN|nr:hypothetical protein GIB67_038004 [Kingdonia uniflora]
MEASSSQSSELDEESIILLQLLDVFGSRISLREIASAFCKAGRDPNLTYDILCQSKECISSSFTTHDSDGEVTGESSLELQSDNSEEELKCAKGFPKASKSKRCSVSAGSISSILGKSYSRSTVKQKGSPKTTKPLKLNVNKLPMSEPRGNGISLDSAIRTDSLHQDVEDFLYKMLGSGFQLGKDVIHEVLGSCGYDAKKSMDKLVDMSASTLIKSDDIVGSSYENFTDTHPNLASPLRKENSQDMHEAPRNGTELFRQSKEKYNLQKELLNSLFSVSERVEVVHKRIQPVRAVKLIKGVRDRVVAEPLRDTSPERVTDILEPHQDTIEDVEEEEMYQVLRRAAKEHWITMKEYYKAAYDAYASGDLTRADKLLEQVTTHIRVSVSDTGTGCWKWQKISK